MTIADWFGRDNARKIDRIIKKALEKARDKGLKAGSGPNRSGKR